MAISSKEREPNMTEQDFLADVLPNDAITVDDDMSWLEITAPLTGLEQRADIMRPGAQNGVDRVWWADGEYVWFRRAKSNPETLKRHNAFCATGDYRHVETQDGVEIYQLQPKSPFATKKTLDIGQMDMYNVRRQAVKAACRHDWPAFRDIMTFLRERVNARHGKNAAGAELEFTDLYMAVMASIDMRHGPSAGTVSNELMALAGGRDKAGSRVITFGAA
jgi:hypothetical protein